jgi:hypothetical protein
MDARTDRLTAVYVDLAANIADVFGMYPAVCYLHERNVSLGIVRRVILELGPRRGDGNGARSTRGQRLTRVWSGRDNPPSVDRD